MIMAQPLLISFGDDLGMLQTIHHQVEHSYDFWTVPFQHRQRIDQFKGKIAVLIVLSGSDNQEALHQVSILQMEYPQWPLLLVTEVPRTVDVVLAFKLGIDDLLVYPTAKDDLQNTLSRLIALRKKKKINYQWWWKQTLRSLRQMWDLINMPARIESIPTIQLHVAAPKQNTIPLIQPIRVLAEAIPPPSEELEVKLFGDFEIIHKNHKLIKWPGQKARSILAFLLTQHQKKVHKEILMDKFWPDSEPCSARNSLNVAMHSIRKSLLKISPHEEIIKYEHNSYTINTELKIKLDVDEFLKLWKEGRSQQQLNLEQCIHCYKKAVALYRGDFMESMRYENWAEMERESLKETYLVILNTLCQYYFEQGENMLCISMSKLMLEKDHCLEGVHRRLMECYAQQGLKDKALRQFEKCKTMLHQELETQPSEKTVNLFRRIKGVGIV